MENPECGGCHSLMDGIGFGFEHFDAIGAWRTSYASGTAVDATGMIVGGNVGGHDVGAMAQICRDALPGLA
jgi:hypothetical protein